MATSYGVFYEVFLHKILEYHYIDSDVSFIEKESNKYLNASVSQFRHYCTKYNFSNRDEEEKCFNFDIEEDDFDEVVDIITDGMVVDWFKKYICNSDALENVLTTKDFALYSPANLNFRNRETYEMLKQAFINKMREYSFTHNDIGVFNNG